MARKTLMHGLAGIKEDAMEVLSVGVGAVAGVAAAKAVTGWVESQSWVKDEKGEQAMWAKVVVPLIPLAVGVGVVYLADKQKLKGSARQAAIGVAAGMAAVSVGKAVKAVSSDLASKLYLNGLGANVDTYDSGLLAGLGEMDASVARYMMAGSPTQVQTLMGAPIQVQALAGAPTQVQTLAAAPMSATLM